MNVCEMCEGRREDAYWSNSEHGAVHFFAKVLPKGFHQSLAIPMTYVRNMLVKLPIRVSLKVADGRVWNVGVKEREGNMVLGRGWREFVEDNSLNEDDILVFRYHDFGQVCFHVQLFDQTGYEKDKFHQYVQDSKKRARQDNHTEAKKPKSEAVEVQTELHQNTVNPSPQEGREFKRAGPCRAAIDEPGFVDVKPLINLQKENVVSDGFQVERQSNPVETAHEIPSLRTPTRNANGEDHPGTSQRRRSTRVRRVYTKKTLVSQCRPLKDVKYKVPTDQCALPSKGFVRNVDGEDGQKTSQQRKSTRNSSRKSKKRVEEREEKIEAESILSKSKAEHDSISRSPIGHGKTYRLYLISQRRAVTDEERHRAFQSANAITSYKPNFISVMKPSNVLQRFFLTIPQRLMREHIPHKAKEAILRVPPASKAWAISLSVRSFSAGLNIGWADFVFDNNLEEGDVCLFEMCGMQQCGRFLIDVSIHRVIQEVVPLIRVLPSPSTKGKKRV